LQTISQETGWKMLGLNFVFFDLTNSISW